MIKVCAIKKHYRVYRRKLGILRDLIGFGVEGRDFDLVKSLDGVNLEVETGRVHGIIGMNGAGKSTLLKILTGVLDPSSGAVEISGRVAALLELGTGFHGELSGRENVIINAAVLGVSRAEILGKMSQIQDFAELGAFFDRPVKIYSSGMYVRLAFAFAVSVNPDVLIVDEALSVGDAYFQQKCLEKIREFKTKGVTILFVSHDLGAVKLLCDSVSLLNLGKVVFEGSPVQALDLYNSLLGERQLKSETEKVRNSTAQKNEGEDAYDSGNKKITIEKVRIVDNSGRESLAVVSGGEYKIEIIIKSNLQEEVEAPTCGILIRDRLGYDVFGLNTADLDLDIKKIEAGKKYHFTFSQKMNLGPGDYTITTALHKGITHAAGNYHWIERALLFRVLPTADYNFIGVARLNSKICLLPAN